MSYIQNLGSYPVNPQFKEMIVLKGLFTGFHFKIGRLSNIVNTNLNVGFGCYKNLARKKSSCLKLLWVLSGTIVSSQIFSSVGIQLVARWQFCNTTHVPSTIALLIILAAIGPWPWPREIV